MSFDATKSTKGASKLRRDLINAEIANLRDLLPLPSSTRQRLSQLQLMALVCVYVRKANYFHQVFRKYDTPANLTPNIGFSKAMSGFLMMSTQNGKLLYISDNAAEYLGHSMEDLLIHGDSVYDIIDKQDHQAVQSELMRAPSLPGDEERLFLCRMNVSRNARRQMRFGDQKVVLVRGHFVSFLPLCSRNEPVFLALCTPVAMPETRECVVQGATHVFTSIHSMDMKFLHIDRNGEYYLGYSKTNIQGISWYQLVHWEHMCEAQSKHKLITQSEQEKSGILLLRLLTRSGTALWIHAVLQVKDNLDNSQQPVVVCTNQVLSEREANVMRANASLYHYYSVQSKLQYGVAYAEPPRLSTFYAAPMTSFSSPEQQSSSVAAAAVSVAPAAYFPPLHGPPNGSQPPPHYGFPPPGAYQPHSLVLGGGGGGVAAAMAVPVLPFAHPAAPKRLLGWKSAFVDEEGELDEAALGASNAIDSVQTVPDVSVTCQWGARASLLPTALHELREQHVPDVGTCCRTPSPARGARVATSAKAEPPTRNMSTTWKPSQGGANPTSNCINTFW